MPVASLITPVVGGANYATIPAGNNRAIFRTIVYQQGSDINATAPSSVTIGGVAATFVAGDGPGVSQIRATSSTYMLLEHQIAQMVGSAVVVSGGVGSFGQSVDWGVQGASQTVPTRTGKQHVTTGPTSIPLSRAAESWTYLAGYVRAAEEITLANPSRLVQIANLNIGFAADTAVTVNSTTQSKTYVQNVHVINIEPMAPYTITSVNSGNGIRAGSTGNTAQTAGFTSPVTSGTYGGKPITITNYNSGTGVVTFNFEGYQDGVTYPNPLNSHSLILTNGSETANFAGVPLLLPVGSSSITIASLVNASNRYLAFWDTQATNGDYYIYPTETGGFEVYADTGVRATNTGNRTIWRYDISDSNFTRVDAIVTDAGDIVVDDTTPDAFSFGSVNNAALSTVVNAPNQVTLAGITPSVNVLATPANGLQFRISTNGGTSFGSWLTTATNVQNGNVLEARLTSSASNSTATVGTLTIGGVVGSLTVTTQAAANDTVPDAFSFGSVTNAPLSTVTTALNQVTVSGLTPGVNVLATPTGGLSFRISTNNGTSFGSWLTSATNVQNGYVLEARLTSSASNSTTTTGTLTIGGVAGTLAVTTVALVNNDTTPNPFTFGTLVGVSTSKVIVSPNQVMLSGMTPAVNVTATPSGGLSFRVSTDGINFGSWLTSASNVQNGNLIEVRLTSSSSNLTQTVGTLTIGGVAGTFTIVTRAASGGGTGYGSALRSRVSRYGHWLWYKK